MQDSGKAPWTLRSEQEQVLGQLETLSESSKGVLLHLPVGFGKTVIALTLARKVQRRTVVIGPARLRSHWERHAKHASVSIDYISHAVLSRWGGDVPPFPRSFLILDEAHRLRNTRTRRYRAAAALVKHSFALLLSATPVVRGINDLYAIGGLFDPVCAEQAFGAAEHANRPSYRSLVDRGAVVRSDESATARVRMRRRVAVTLTSSLPAKLAAQFAECASLDAQARQLANQLVEDAVYSSPGAVKAVTRSMLALDDRAREALNSDSPLTRARYYQLFGSACGSVARGQSVMPWFYSQECPAEEAPLLPLTSEKRQRAERVARRLIELSSECSAATRLRANWDPGVATLVFSRFRASVWHLRSSLPLQRITFVDGERAFGSAFGRARTARFSACMSEGCSIVATDCLGEGIDLPWIQRVVHLELPWTDAQRVQREGRVTRSPDSGVVKSAIEFHRTTLRGERVSQRLRDRKLLTASLERGGANGFNATAPAGARKKQVFHVKHLRQVREIRALRTAICGGEPLTEGHLMSVRRPWVAHDWLEALSRTPSSSKHPYRKKTGP